MLINEVCAKNDSVFAGDLIDYPDYIELYNAGSDVVDLTDWYLSDELNNLQKWRFPSAEIEPGDHFLILADEVDRRLQYLHCNFKLWSNGEAVYLSNDAGLQDSLRFPAQIADIAFGRLVDGGDQKAVLEKATPLSANDSEKLINNYQPPTYASDQYFFSAATSVELQSAITGSEIRFSRDGTFPDENSELYSGAINIDSSTVIRAVVFAENYLPSATATFSFFIGSQHTLPVVSICGDPDAFWSIEDGILVDGLEADAEWPFYGANYWRDVQVPVHMQYFGQDQKLTFQNIFDTEVHGGRSSRTKDQKSIRLLVKKRFGSFDVQYPFFEDRENNHYKRLVLRNASGDHNVAHLRDAFLSHYFAIEQLDLHLLAYRPTAIYLNGEYYGIINLREKSDKYYLHYNYDVSLDSLDFLEEDTLLLLGSFHDFDEMLSFCENNDLSVDENYKIVSEQLDIENFAETFIVESVFNNSDWLSNNIKFWRAQRTDEKWRYLTFDLDDCMGRYGWTTAKRNLLDSFFNSESGDTKHSRIFLALAANEGYRNYFINRYADLLNTSFKTEQISDNLTSFIAQIDGEMESHFERWPSQSYDDWMNEDIPEVYEFLEDRPAFAREYLRAFFDLVKEVELEFSAEPMAAGTIEINTIEPELPFTGIYFDGAPIELTAKAAAGFRFSHWESVNGDGGENRNPQLSVNFDSDTEIFAHFMDEDEEGIFISSAQVLNNSEVVLQAFFSESGSADLELYNLHGQLVTKQESANSVGDQQINFGVPPLSAGIYIVRIRNEKFDSRVKILIEEGR